MNDSFKGFKRGVFTPVDGQPIDLGEILEANVEDTIPPDGPSPETTRIEEMDGYPFTLADGREWFLARPMVRLRPRPNGDGKNCDVVQVWDYPPSVRARVDTLLQAYANADTIALSLIVTVAVSLLRLCHRLDFEQAASLFELTIKETEDIAVGMLRMFRGEILTDRESTPEDPGQLIEKVPEENGSKQAVYELDGGGLDPVGGLPGDLHGGGVGSDR
jgi:hypothetical protein